MSKQKQVLTLQCGAEQTVVMVKGQYPIITFPMYGELQAVALAINLIQGECCEGLVVLAVQNKDFHLRQCRENQEDRLKKLLKALSSNICIAGLSFEESTGTLIFTVCRKD